MLSETERQSLLEEADTVQKQMLELYADLGKKVYEKYKDEPMVFPAEIKALTGKFDRLAEIDLLLNPRNRSRLSWIRWRNLIRSPENP